ncbi:MAG: DUF5060 domain-containing protein [Armatimonadota bacterium]|nr:DUF5060 domain-containing protein [Armatimonadota bacterium]
MFPVLLLLALLVPSPGRAAPEFAISAEQVAALTDSSPPTDPQVTDDGDYTNCSTSIHAEWTASDPESGISEYWYAIGTWPGGDDWVGWTFAGTSTEVTVTDLDLFEWMTYFVSVYAVNGEGEWSIGYSDGITVDTVFCYASVIGDNSGGYPAGCVPMFSKYEAKIETIGVGTEFSDYNPYNPNVFPLGGEYYNGGGMLVDAVLRSPTGRRITWPCFWHEETGGWRGWMLRFAPTEVGRWHYHIRAVTLMGTLVTCEREFECVSGPKHGFVQVDPTDRRFFRFQDGSPIFFTGADVSGYSGDGGVEGAALCAFPQMAQYGANFSRVFFTSSNIEAYNVGSNKCQYSSLNSYWQNRARSIDQTIQLAEQYGIYLEWVVDDWTYLKDSSNQYIRPSDCAREAPALNTTEFFSQPNPAQSKEIYKRKLRYWLARWGYSTNLMALELINEVNDDGPDLKTWHNEMCDYVHSFSEQPHLVSSSNGSGWLSAERGIDWTSPSVDFVNFHDYAKYSNQWGYLHSAYPFAKLGIDSVWPDPPARGSCDDYGYPWIDTAVWFDRLARVYHKQYQWNKPLIWSEFGLIYRDCTTTGYPDWDQGYIADTTALHFRPAVWAAFFSASAISHWKLGYMLGLPPYSGGSKFWVFGALSNFIAGEDFRGLTQETAYPVSDPLNPNPRIKCFIPGSTTPQAKVMAMSLRDTNRAYIYVKNVTNTWARLVDPDIAPVPSPRSADVKLYGMAPGSYLLETWSADDTNKATQQLSAVTLMVGDDGVARVNVSNLAQDMAYKLKCRGFWPGVKAGPNGASVNSTGATVSAAWPDFFYLEADPRTCGIRVEKAGHGLSVGMRADVTGVIRTNLDGERYIDAAAASQSPPPDSTGSVNPLMMSGKLLGGGDSGYVAATGAGQRGVEGGKGINNIGILVRVCGRVAQIDPNGDYFYVDDGSGISDGTTTEVMPGVTEANRGVRVSHSGFGVEKGDYVVITGVSSCFSRSGSLKRLILPRQGEIQAIQRRPYGFVPSLKWERDGSSVTCEGAIVSAAWTGYFYVESDSRCGGIRVEMPWHGLAVGMRADFTGIIRTNSSGERYIAASSASQSPPPYSAGSVSPLNVNCRILGGGDWRYSPSIGAGQRGVDGGQGLNNIGLLVRVIGKMTQVDQGGQYFYIDDGGNLKDGTKTLSGSGQPRDNVGVRVLGTAALIPTGSYVTVTGISSCFDSGGKLKRAIIPRPGEIQLIPR